MLKKEKLNIYAITTSDNIDHNIIRLVVDQPVSRARAARGLRDAGPADRRDHDRRAEPAGAIAEIAKRLGEAKVNIDYLYCATAPTAKTGLLVFKPSNVAKALKALNQRKA